MARFQNGSLLKIKRKGGEQVWAFRWYESAGESRIYRKRIIGTLAQLPGRRDAERVVSALRININSGAQIPQTVVDLVAHYRKHEMVLEHKAASTIEVYGTFLNLYVIPHWGSMRLDAVRTVEVESWLSSLPYSPGTRSKIRNLMSALFNHAIRHEWMQLNPITLVRCSAKRLRVPDVLTPNEFRALLSHLERRDRAMVVLAGSTGLRRSELIALTWGDIAFDRFEITVRRSRVRRCFGEPKTEASRKPVPLHASVADELKLWRTASPFPAEADFLFPSIRKNGTQPLTPDMLLKRVVRPAAEAAGIQKRIGWHTFRHSLATNLRWLGVDVKVAQELLRHANSRITMDIYTQAVSSEKALANGRATDLLLAQVPSTLTAPSEIRGETLTC
jgi:integrase